jgi:hypothetical protein
MLLVTTFHSALRRLLIAIGSVVPMHQNLLALNQREVQCVRAAYTEEAHWETAFCRIAGIIHRFQLVSVIS